MRAVLAAELPKGLAGIWVEGVGVGLGVGSERRPLMAASSNALEDSGLERFLEAFLGWGREEAAPRWDSWEAWPEGPCAVAEASCSWGRASAAVAIVSGSGEGWLMQKFGGLKSAVVAMKCLLSSSRTCTMNTPDSAVMHVSLLLSLRPKQWGASQISMDNIALMQLVFSMRNLKAHVLLCRHQASKHAAPLLSARKECKAGLPHLLAVAACLQVLQEPLQLLRRGAESQRTNDGTQPIRRLTSASSRQRGVTSRHHLTANGYRRRGNGCRHASDSAAGDALPEGCQS